jgi:integrase
MSRREGSVIQRGATSWQLKFDVPTADGTRKTIRETVRAATKAEAQKLLNARLAERDTGMLVQPTGTTLVAAVAETIAAAQYVAKFDERCRTILRRYVEPYFGAIRLQQITPADISLWQDWLRQQTTRGAPLAAATQRQIAKLVRQALTRAVNNQLLARNPAAGTPLPKDERREMVILTPAKLDELVPALAAHPWPMFQRLAPLAYCAAYTGARLAELLAMRWSDLDLAAGSWRVTRSFEQIGRELRIRPCKNASSRRVIGLGADLVAYLQHYRIEQAARLLAQGRRIGADDLVFDNGAGNPLLPNNVSSDWIKAMKRLDFQPRIRFHHLRHTHASLGIEARMNPLKLSRRLGHANTNITFGIYGHLFDNDDRDDAAAIEAILRRGKTPA